MFGAACVESVEGLHCGEEQNVPDGGGIGQEHDNPVDAETDAGKHHLAVDTHRLAESLVNRKDVRLFKLEIIEISAYCRTPAELGTGDRRAA